MSWADDALCVGQWDLFYVSEGESVEPARELCAACPVLVACRVDCDEFESTHRGEYGFRAGETPRERRARRQLHGAFVCETCSRPFASLVALAAHRSAAHDPARRRRVDANCL